MTYTQHLSKVLQSSGVPHFSIKGFQTMMNIVHLEGKIKELESLIKNSRTSEKNGYYTFLINDYLRKIKELTNDKLPQELLKNLCET